MFTEGEIELLMCGLGWYESGPCPVEEDEKKVKELTEKLEGMKHYRGSENIEWDQAAFRSGFGSRESGALINENPYFSESVARRGLHDSWNAGYADADMCMSEKDNFIGGALLCGIKNKLFETIETLKSKDATLGAICLMLKKEPSPEALEIIEAVISGANCQLLPSYFPLIRAMLAGKASCSFCANWNDRWTECSTHNTERPRCICGDFEFDEHNMFSKVYELT